MENFLKGLASSFAVVFTSEIGDKTFIFIAVFSQKHSISAVLLGTQLGLAPLIVLAAYVGKAATFLPKFYLDIISFVLFFILSLLAFKECYHEYKKNSEDDNALDSQHSENSLSINDPLIDRQNSANGFWFC